MITESDKELLIETLLITVQGLDTPRQSLVAPFLNTHIPGSLGQGTPRELVTKIISLCIGDSWNNTPPLLITLIDSFDLKILNQEIAKICDRIGSPPPAGLNLLQVSIINNATPFVNRVALRTKLEGFESAAADAQPILIITGDTKSGKSYSSNYIDHFSHVRQTVITCKVELDPDLALETGPEQVARDLVTMMGRPLGSMPSAVTNLKLYAKQLASWVLHEAVQGNAKYWFVLDNFIGEKLREDTKAFLIALSDKITTGVFRQRCRLILLGFEKSILTVEPGKICEDTVTPYDKTDIAKFIDEIRDRCPVKPDPTTLEKKIFDNLPNDETKMSELNQRSRALILLVAELTMMVKKKPELNFLAILEAIMDDLAALSTNAVKQKISVLKSSLNDL
ncbi:MAG: hypothetical protein WD824_15815 [Cyclobacteriaceae bacterium]